MSNPWFTPRPASCPAARGVPAGQLGAPAPGRPDPGSPTAGHMGAPRWVGCLVDSRRHLLAADGVLAVMREGSAPAWCGRPILPSGLVLTGPSTGLCPGCLAVGGAQ